MAFHPLSDDKIKEALRSVYGGRSYASFINLVKSFISLYKSRYEDDSAFEELKKTQFKTKYGKVRADLFLSICQKVLEYYRDKVRLDGKIDFDDMILKAIRVLPDLPRFRFEHILVDEFQDISYSRSQFLKALIAHGKSNLFAVGDDWQSIYRFSGCDVNIFLHFEEIFGFSEIHRIGNVHRNSQQLQDSMTKFIEANPEQLKKEIHSDKRIADPIRVMYYDDDGYLALMRTLGLIAKNHPKANILLLGRNNKDIEPYLAHDFFFDRKAGQYFCNRYPDLHLSYSTVHGSKGLEEDFVILLSAEDAPNGFPNKTEDDPLLNLVMSEPSRYLFAEERRLWYVALTRTRSYVFILVPKAAPSLFIDEMRGSFKEINPSEKDDPSCLISCPRCRSGHLVLRQKEDGRPFYGCSNYPYCKYTIDDLEAVSRNKRCLVCGDFMILKKGEWGSFYGCHSYPRCKFTTKHDPRIPEK